MMSKFTMSQLIIILIHCILHLSNHGAAGQIRRPVTAATVPTVPKAPSLESLIGDVSIQQDPSSILARATLNAPAVGSNLTQRGANLRPRSSSSGDSVANSQHQAAINQGAAPIGAQVSSKTASSGKLAASGASSQLHQHPHSVARNSSTSLANVRQSWRLMEQSLASAFRAASFNLQQALDELLVASNRSSNGRFVPPISVQCKSALEELFVGLGEQELWADRMLDSSALRLPSGTLEGTLTELGHFDECLAISHTNRHKSGAPAGAASPAIGTQPINGQYCSLHIRPPLINRPRLHTVCRRLPNLSSTTTFANVNGSDTLPLVKFLAQNSQQFLYVGLRLGICTPSQCSQADVQQVLGAYLAKYELIGQVKYCQQLDRRALQSNLDQSESSQILGYLLQAYSSSSILQNFDPVQQCILLVFGLLFLLTVAGTWLDTSHKRRRPPPPPPPPKISSVAPSVDLGQHGSGPGSRGMRTDLDAGEHLEGGQRACGATMAAAHAPKRWQQYQVCRDSTTSNTCCSDRSSDWDGTGTDSTGDSNLQTNLIYLASSDGCREANDARGQQLGLQKNPVAELVVVGSSSLSATSAPSSSSSPSSDSHLSSPSFPQAAPDAKGTRPADVGQASRGHKQKSSSPHKGNRLNALQVAGDEAARLEECMNTKSTDESRPLTTGNHSLEILPPPPPPPSMFVEVLICFSLKSNLRVIGKLAAASQQCRNEGCATGNDTGGNDTVTSDIKVIHGLRTLSMIWIIFGHTIGLVNPEMMNNLFPLAQLSCSSRFLQALLNTTLAVDTFFMISGLVTVISFVRKCKSALILIRSASSSLIKTNDDCDDYCTRPEGGSSSACPSQQPPVVVDLLELKHDTNSTNSDNNNNRGPATGTTSANCTDSEASSVDDSASSSAITSLGSSRQCIGTPKDSLGTNKHRCNNNSRGEKQRRMTSTPSGSWWPRDFKPLLWLLMRYLRLTPAYATIIGLSVVMPALGSGPFWAETVGQLGPACRANWWLNMLYLNNFLETDKLCLIHSWYLSNDWQFFLLALILFATFYKSKKLTLLLIVSAILASSAATFVSTVANDFPPTIVTTSPAVAERWQFIYSLYYKPWPHLPSYLIGLIAGYLILNSGQKRSQSSSSLSSAGHRRQLSSGGRFLCWLLFSVIAFAVLNSIYPWNMGIQVDPILTGIHSATFRTLWATCCAWLVFALVTRPRNILALLLSWHGFQVTSRLTYCAYLVHPLIIYYHFGTLRERLDSSVYGQLHRFMATLAQSYLFAFLLSLLVEGPSIQLQRFITNLYCAGKGAKLSGSPMEQQVNCGTNNPLNTPSVDHNRGQPHLGDSAVAGGGSAQFGLDLNQYWITSGPGEKIELADGDLGATGNRSRCGLHHQMEGQGLSESLNYQGGSTTAIDVEFQKKLAQAIGRGFKIRTKIVNGTIRQPPVRVTPARRLGPAKRLPNQTRAELAPIFAADIYPNDSIEGTLAVNGHAHDRGMDVLDQNAPSRFSAKPAIARRAEPLSTFVSPNLQHSKHQQHKSASIGVSGERANVDLNEMMQIKQRLLSRS